MNFKSQTCYQYEQHSFYNAIHKYLDSGTISALVSLSGTLYLKWNNEDELKVHTVTTFQYFHPYQVISVGITSHFKHSPSIFKAITFGPLKWGDYV